jgi:hypothetical protein
MPNLELARKTHDLLYYLEKPRIYDSGKEPRKIFGFQWPRYWTAVYTLDLNLRNILVFGGEARHQNQLIVSFLAARVF